MITQMSQQGHSSLFKNIYSALQTDAKSPSLLKKKLISISQLFSHD